jgi:hypothetical protein
MKGKITLSNPITINGKKVKTLNYDANEITSAMFAEADARKMRASGTKGGNLSGAVELDYGLHLYLGFATITSVNPEIDIADLERMRGKDVMSVMRIGRNFIISSADESEDDNSEDQSETTPEPSTLQSQTSKEKE